MASCGAYGQQPYDDPNQGYEPEPMDQSYGAQPNYGGVPMDGSADCDDCVQLVKSVKRVQVPCTRPRYSQYTVKVPRQVTQKVPRTVHYTEQETRTKQVPYTVNRTETRFKEEQQSYTVPKQVTKTRMVNVTKKVPKTIYVDVVTQEPQEYTVMEHETRFKTVKIPYTINVPETKYRVENYTVDMPRVRTVMDNVTKTVFDDVQKTRCEQVTRMVTKEVPVYRVVTKQPQAWQAPVETGYQETQAVEYDRGYDQGVSYDQGYAQEPAVEQHITTTKTTYSAPEQYDADGNGVLDAEEIEAARKAGVLEENTTQTTEVVRGDSQAGYGAPAPQAPAQDYGQEPQDAAPAPTPVKKSSSSKKRSKKRRRRRRKN